MHQKPKKIDAATISSATFMSIKRGNEAIEKADRYRDDVDKESRIHDSICRSCYYFMSVRIGGAAMTTRPCGKCGEDHVYSSTATDVLCIDCADHLELCKQCGGDLHQRKDRSCVDKK